MVAVDFGNLCAAEGLAKLDAHLKKNSYITGYNATQDDALVLKSLKCVPSAETHPCLSRWFRHVMFFTDAEQKMWPKGQGVAGCAAAPAPAAKAAARPAPAKKVDEDDDDDDDFDPFAEETEEDKAAKEKMAEKAKAAVKPKKVVINKSTLVIDVKPNSTETNLDEVEKLVRQIEIEGVEWSKASKKLPIAFGLMKLQIGCTIIDDLVNTDVIVDLIECVGLNEADSKKKIAIRDGEIEVDDEEEEEELGLVQSAEIVSFNKL